MANAADECQLVGLEALTRTAAVSKAAASHLNVDLLDGDLHPRRKPLDNYDERLTVRFAGGEVTEHRGETTGTPITLMPIDAAKHAEHGQRPASSARSAGQRCFGSGPHHARVGANAGP